MLLYRWIKRSSFMDREFSKYLWYAVGEMFLVIAGIIVALQLDSWYDNKQTQERLNDYLENIARNVTDDVQRLQQLKSIRVKNIFQSISTLVSTGDPEDGNTDWYNAALTASASAALERAQQTLYFVASSGSYQALESSGLVSKLSDSELETMLYDYYQTVDRIANLEQDMNDVVRELTLKFRTETTKGLNQFVAREPLFLWQEEVTVDPEEPEKSRQLYWNVLSDSVTHSLLRSTVNQSVMQEYEHLLSLGRQLVHKIGEELGHTSPDRSTEDTYFADSPIGHPILIEAGLPEYHSYGLFTAPGNSRSFEFVYTNVWIEDDALYVRYAGGEPWAYFYIKYGLIDFVVERFTNDYSVYDRIRLELKREADTECAALRLEIKDIDDAEKGGLRSVPLALTPEWQTYTVDLAEFVEADLTRLNVVAGFFFGSPQPCSISIRDVRYLRPD